MIYLIISRRKPVGEKIQNAFIIKVLENPWIKGTYLNIMKVIYSKPIAKYVKWLKI